jgi:hypothetical protein
MRKSKFLLKLHRKLSKAALKVNTQYKNLKGVIKKK